MEHDAATAPGPLVDGERDLGAVGSGGARALGGVVCGGYVLLGWPVVLAFLCCVAVRINVLRQDDAVEPTAPSYEPYTVFTRPELLATNKCVTF